MQAGSICFSANFHSGPSALPPGTSTSVAGAPAKRKAVRGAVKGPASLHSSPGQSQRGNKWRAPLGGSDSETTRAWRPAVTHSTSMGELSVQAENTKALFFPSLLSLFCPPFGGVVQHQGCPETYVSHHWLQKPPWKMGSKQDQRGRATRGKCSSSRGSFCFTAPEL